MIARLQNVYWLTLLLVGGLIPFYEAHGAAGSKAEEGKFYGAKSTEYPDWFKASFLDFKEDVAEAAAHGKRFMLIFTQDGCPYCNALVERNLAQKDIEQYMRKHFDVVAINMWGDRQVATIGGKEYTEKAFAKALKVQFTPTIMFFNEQGKVVLRVNGYLPPHRFKVALEYVGNKKEKDIEYRDYVAANVKETGGKGDMNDEPYFLPAPYDLQRKGDKPLAVFFEQKHCPNCDTLHNKVLVDDLPREALKDFDVVQLDMWSDTPVVTPNGTRTTARNWAKQLDVKYAPTIVLFNGQGKEVIRSEAFFKVFHTAGILTYVSSGSYKEQPSFQRYLAAKAEHMREQGKDVDIWRLGNEKPGERKN
jgi:thioredoxin-related protein